MSWWSRLVRTFQPGSHTEEIEDELAYHLAMKEQDGADPRAARLKLGNSTFIKEETRAQGIFTSLESLARDVRYGWRQLRRAPAVTLVVSLMLALGIGANSAIFSLVDAALLKRLPVKDAASLRLIEWKSSEWPEGLCSMLTGDSEQNPGEARGSSIAPRIYRELARQQNGFGSLIGFSDGGPVSVALSGKPAEQLNLQYVSTNFFQELGVMPRLGRTFSEDEDRTGSTGVVLISQRLWRSHFGGRQDVLGQMLRINNVPVEIIGVEPAGFFGVKIGEWEDLYAPLAAETTLSPQARLDPAFAATDGYWWVRMLGRLKPGVEGSQAIERLSTIFRRLVVPEGLRIGKDKVPTLVLSHGGGSFNALRANQVQALWIVVLLAGLILLIICANVANLLLARAVARQRESAVCLALGAGRLRLFRQYLVESLTLALAGGAAGCFLSYVLTRAMQHALQADLRIGEFDLSLDTRVLVFTLLVSCSTALLFGLAPAWQLTSTTVHGTLKASSRTVVGGRLTLPRLLVALQIGLSFTVLLAAGLLDRSLAKLKAVNLGFSGSNLLYVSVDPWSAGYNPQQVHDYTERLRPLLAAMPGITHSGIIEERPLSGNANATIVDAHGQPASGKTSHVVLINGVSEGLFETLGIPLLNGRLFKPGDMQPKADAVIVDENFVKAFYPHRNPIGEQFGKLHRIVGVVKNSRYNSLRDAALPTMFLPYVVTNRPGWPVTFAMRSAMDSKYLTPAIRKVAAEIDANVPVTEIRTQSALIDHLLLLERLLSFLSSAFGTVALLLSAIGLIGLLAYMVARRTNEIGVRMAVGAARADVVRLVLKDSLLLLIIGLLVGVPGALLLGRYLKHVLFGLQTTDPATALLSLAVLTFVTGIASWIPAWRAARIDPMTALREE